MTLEDITRLQIPIEPLDNTAVLYVESAIGWINQNTTLEYDINALPESLPSNVRLFIVKFNEIMHTDPNIASESIQGLSQSFATNGKGLLLYEYARSLLGEYMPSQVVAVQTKGLWL